MRGWTLDFFWLADLSLQGFFSSPPMMARAFAVPEGVSKMCPLTGDEGVRSPIESIHGEKLITLLSL